VAPALGGLPCLTWHDRAATVPGMLTLAAEALAFVIACQGGPGTPPEQNDGGPPVQTNPDVGESQHDSSPPLRDIPPAKREPGQRVHPLRRIPRPPPADGGQPEEENK